LDEPVRSRRPLVQTAPTRRNRSERIIITDLIGLRQADASHVPPDRARYGLRQPTLSPVRRTVRHAVLADRFWLGDRT
jgi:hypothetical protein